MEIEKDRFIEEGVAFRYRLVNIVKASRGKKCGGALKRGSQTDSIYWYIRERYRDEKGERGAKHIKMVRNSSFFLFPIYGIDKGE